MATVEEREAQKSYWLEHSSQPTVEAMMLDSKASEIDQLERPEVLSTLGSVAGMRVLELGAGIGRFTGELAKTAKSVMACDFMEVSIAENRRQHEQLGNTSFLVADVTELEQGAGSYDVVFSNWLLMYLSDAEVQQLANKVLSWLSPGGILFFRESCFRPSGDRPRKGNPTHYRNPRDYFAIFDQAELCSPDGSSSAHLELVCCKCVDTYVTVKKNQNQICWKFQKAVVPKPRPPLYRTFLDTHQYTDRAISLYERVYGTGFVSPGGETKASEILSKLQLKPGMRVLDVGCGTGGYAFLASDTYGCHVHGIDLSVNMILTAIERAAAAISRSGGGAAAAAPVAAAANGSHCTANGTANGVHANGSAAAGANGNGSSSSSSCDPSPSGRVSPQQQMPHDVTFEVADVLLRDFPADSFDVVMCKDSLLHVEDKQALFSRLFRWLRPGGLLLVTDYCKPSSGCSSEALAAYVELRQYSLMTLADYRSFLAAAGFAGVKTADVTAELVSSLEAELAAVQAEQTAFESSFSPAEFQDVMGRWVGKLGRAKAGEQLWGLITAFKPQLEQ